MFPKQIFTKVNFSSPNTPPKFGGFFSSQVTRHLQVFKLPEQAFFYQKTAESRLSRTFGKAFPTPLAAGAGLAYLNPFESADGLGQRLELLSVYAEAEALEQVSGHLGLALLTALLFQSYGTLLTATRPVTAIFAFLCYLLGLLLPLFGLDGDYLGVIHLLVYPGAILIFFAFASLTTDQRGS